MKTLIKPRSVKINSLISFAGIFISRILGFVRDMLIGYFFGTSPITDAFNITMKIIFYLANQISSAFNIGFLSLFIHEREAKGQESAEKLASSIVTFVGIFGIAISGIFFLFAPYIANLYPGINITTYNYLVIFLRFTAISFFIITSSGIIWSIYQANHIFTIPYIAVLLQNSAIVLIIYLFHNALSLPISIIAGTTLMFIFTLLPLKRIIKLNLLKPSKSIIKEFIVISSPTLISTGVIYFSVLVDQIMASLMPVGSITRLEYANKLASLPSAMFGIAIASAFFPKLSEFVSRKEWKNFLALLENGVSAIWFLTIPSAVGLILLSNHIVHLLFYFPSGKFTFNDVNLTAGAMAMYALGIPFQSAIIAFNRGHYSFKDTITPLKSSSLTLIINIILNYTLGIILGMGIKGLALGTSLAGIINFWILGHTLEKKVRERILAPLIQDFLRILIYTLPMGIFLILTNLYFYTVNKITTIIIIIIAVILYGVFIVIIKPKELKILIRKKSV